MHMRILSFVNVKAICIVKVFLLKNIFFVSRSTHGSGFIYFFFLLLNAISIPLAMPNPIIIAALKKLLTTTTIHSTWQAICCTCSFNNLTENDTVNHRQNNSKIRVSHIKTYIH